MILRPNYYYSFLRVDPIRYKKEGIVHCVPAPGFQGCVLRWKSKDSNKPVEF